jgi:hypothetical protein
MDADHVCNICVDQRESAVAPSSRSLRGAELLSSCVSRLSTYTYVLNRLFHPTRRGAPKTTGQIQNAQDFFRPGFAEVPTRDCLNSGLEFCAHVVGSYSGGGDFLPLRASLRRTFAARLTRCVPLAMRPGQGTGTLLPSPPMGGFPWVSTILICGDAQSLRRSAHFGAIFFVLPDKMCNWSRASYVSN